MRASLGYFVAAALFLIATALNFYNEGLNLKTGIGLVFFISLLAFALRSRRAGK